MKSLHNLEKEIEAIKTRNKKVEADKAWEVSFVRRILISASTYVLISVFMYAIGVEKPLVSAIIPAIAYLISTHSLELFKSWWLRKQKE